MRLTGSRQVGAYFQPRDVLVSWNPAYRYCKPILTTIPSILGSQRSSYGGATEGGGGLQPHLRGDPQKHLLYPPCTIGGTATFVEIHDVLVAGPDHPERSADGDETVNMADPNRPDITSIYMKRLLTEIDNKLIVHKVAPPIQPPIGSHIDVQGFVFWDPGHTTEGWHSYSGWELHTLTAWWPAGH
jgi:hypothetical protein